ncbi:MAG: hypothetical protein Q7J54_02750 [Candidatus Woesearchaeota archaeon]|nr:hypothetical protein [Candidatus Woesearchaeota archaeon]
MEFNNRLLSLLLFLSLLFIPNLVIAADFSITSVQQLTSNPYRGDLVQFKGVIQADPNNICEIECSYSVSSNTGYVSNSGDSPATKLGKGTPQEFPFSVMAEGSGQVNTNLQITCVRVASWFPPCTPSTLPTQSRQISFNFLYPGDGNCTSLKEKCSSYLTYIGTTDCSCLSSKECRPDGNRDLDSKGCQTYCGNKIYEAQYEDCDCATDFTCPLIKKCKPDNGRALDDDGCATYCGNGICEKESESCSICPQDCKKCDLASCFQSFECEGGYCLWSVCWYASTRKDDGHCDNGENCANSPNDCACPSSQKCGDSKVCETYCGNSVCEENEKGICKADCKWCGDGSCNSDKGENCKTCESDCGVCENQKLNQEISEKAKEVVKEGLNEASQKQKIITFSALGLIGIFIIGYILFKLILHNKSKKIESKKNLKKKK